MSNNAEIKIVLLLTPQRMLKDNVVLESLHIHKNGRSVDYIINQLDNSELRRYYPDAPSTLKLLLSSFREDAVAERAAAIKKRHATQRAGIAFEIYFINAMLRELHELF